MPARARSKPAALRTAAEGRIACYLDVELAEALKRSAQERGSSASTVISLALREFFARHPPSGYKPPADDLTGDKTPVAAQARAQELEGSGAAYENIVAALNDEGFRTPRGKPWNVVSVGRMLRRLRPGQRKTRGRAARRVQRDTESLQQNISPIGQPKRRAPTGRTKPPKPSIRPPRSSAPLRRVIDYTNISGRYLLRLECGHEDFIGRRPAARRRCDKCRIHGCICEKSRSRKCPVHGPVIGTPWITKSSKHELEEFLATEPTRGEIADWLNETRYLARPGGRPWTARAVGNLLRRAAG